MNLTSKSLKIPKNKLLVLNSSEIAEKIMSVKTDFFFWETQDILRKVSTVNESQWGPVLCGYVFQNIIVCVLLKKFIRVFNVEKIFLGWIIRLSCYICLKSIVVCQYRRDYIKYSILQWRRFITLKISLILFLPVWPLVFQKMTHGGKEGCGLRPFPRASQDWKSADCPVQSEILFS